MRESDGIHTAIGGTLLATGLVVVAVIVPLAAGAKGDPWLTVWFLIPCGIGAILTCAGIYILGAVYTGWPLPSTASERNTKPRLSWYGSLVRAHVDTIPMGANSCVFELSFANEGRAPISKAVVNVVIPEHIHEFKRSDAAGNTHPEGPGTVATTRETLEADARGDPVRSVYWTGLVDFPGRSAKPLFFCVTWVGQRAELPFRVEVTASELDERFDMSGTLFLVT